ncbi:MAG TPA: biopolymer transporter ExbD [Tepidisphaeraceae bacterium]|jgi:biopolymer transport protein ExbD
MKLKGAKAVHYDSGPNMTPLVDVVMVILIFLMLAGSFGGAEQYLESNMPVTAGGAGGVHDAAVIPPNILEIRVDSPAPDRWVATAGQFSASDGATLKAILDKLRRQYNPTNPEKEDTETQVQISPSRSVKYEYLITAYQAALQSQFTKVGFATAH